MIERLKRLLQAAISDLVDKAVDPELELARFVERVELSLDEIRAEQEEARLRRTRLADQLSEHRRIAADWMSKAEKAAARDDDDKAKQALRAHHSAQAEVESCRERVAESELALATLREDEAALEKKLKEARLEQKRLSAELRRAEAEKRSSAALAAGDQKAGASDDVRGRIMDAQAASETAREVHAESDDAAFAQLHDNGSLDEELEALKRRVKKNKDA